jgi:hypothetical protein
MLEMPSQTRTFHILSHHVRNQQVTTANNQEDLLAIWKRVPSQSNHVDVTQMGNESTPPSLTTTWRKNSAATAVITRPTGNQSTQKGVPTTKVLPTSSTQLSRVTSGVSPHPRWQRSSTSWSTHQQPISSLTAT